MACKRKYNPEWENEEDFKGLLNKSIEEDAAFCNFCKIQIRPHKSVIKRHLNRPQHITKANELRKRTHLDIFVKKKECNIIQELRLAIYVAMHCSLRRLIILPI